VLLDPKCNNLSARPERATYSLSLPARISLRNRNTAGKFDFPEPFAPISRLIGRKGKSLIERMLLKPSIVMDWIVSEAIAIPMSLKQYEDARFRIFADHIAARSSHASAGNASKLGRTKVHGRRTDT
jgi:hypothetical protein